MDTPTTHNLDFRLISEVIFDKLCDNFFSMLVLDTANRQVMPFRRPSGLGTVLHEHGVDWSGYLEEQILPAIREEYRDAVRRFFDPVAVSTVFSGSHDKTTLVYQHLSGKWHKIILQPITITDDGTTALAMATFRDVTPSMEQLQAIEARRLAETERAARYARLFFEATDDVYVGIFQVNLETGSSRRLRYEDGQILAIPLSTDWDTILHRLATRIHPDDQPEFLKWLDDPQSIARTPEEKIQLTYRSLAASGVYRWYRSTVRISLEKDQPILSLFTVDIDEDMTTRATLMDQSEHDSLTDLFNRTKLGTMLATEYQELTSCGVIFFDVNDLKIVNDTLGHKAGDALLKQAADSIRSITIRQVRGYRYGGDEFIAVVCDMDEEEMDALLTLWHSRLKNLILASGIPTTIAVGRAWSTAPISVENLIATADERMYADKIRLKREASANAPR